MRRQLVASNGAGEARPRDSRNRHVRFPQTVSPRRSALTLALRTNYFDVRLVSEVAREILRSALEERPLAERTSHLKGRLRLEKNQTEAWRQTLRQRNWRD